MRATKKRADVIYNALLKHFNIDEFLVKYISFSKKIVIYARKNGSVCNLEVYHKPLEFKWATKHIFTRCSSWPNLHRGALSLEHFFYALKEVSWDFKLNYKSLADIKHELVKQILSSMRRYWYVHVNAAASVASMYEYEIDYTVDRIMNLEELVIQEELNAES